jgi:hypothetical protein
MKAVLCVALLFLTQGNGNTVTIAASNYVASSTAPAKVCPPNAPTVVNTMSATFCVRETPEEIVKQLKQLP